MINVKFEDAENLDLGPQNALMEPIFFNESFTPCIRPTSPTAPAMLDDVSTSLKYERNTDCMLVFFRLSIILSSAFLIFGSCSFVTTSLTILSGSQLALSSSNLHQFLRSRFYIGEVRKKDSDWMWVWGVPIADIHGYEDLVKEIKGSKEDAI